MKLNDVRAKAEEMQIRAGKMKKGDLIKAIQMAEGNTPCFQERSNCDETACCWQDDCTAEMTD